jgi:PTS system nitrogen regulatory IIA component
MQLSLRDAARLLQVAERTLVRSAGSGDLRAQRVRDQLRFNRSELLEWATARRLAIPPALVEPEVESGIDVAVLPTSLSDALAAGGVHHDVPGADRDAALRAVVERLPLPAGTDRDFFLTFLLARENAGSTALGDGIAIPHVRSPLVLQGTTPIVTLCYLKAPIDFKAADGEPVHTLFTFVTGTVRSHLHLLSTLAHVLHDPTVRAALARRAGGEEVVAAVRAAELARLDAAPRRGGS